MPKFTPISLTITRKTNTPDGAGGYTSVPAAITGSPWMGTPYRNTQVTTTGYDWAKVGVANMDNVVAIRFRASANGGLFPALKLNDEITPVFGQNALVKRIRDYSVSGELQIDVEIGTQGVA
jgi:hypothetical protein